MDSNNLTPLRKGIVGVQFLFVAFGATVLVPLLVGLDPSTALFTAGIGTLIFHAVTRGKVPIFLGSSFAFIAPIIKATELYGLPGTLSGMVGVALVYFVMSALVKWQGIRVIEKLFPPVVIGPVIILIGLSLAGTGVNMAKENWVLALLSLVTAVIVSMKAKGLLKLIPIFCGIIVGYLAAWLFYLSVQILRIERIGYRFSWFAGSAAVLVAVVAFADHAFGPSYFFSALFALVAGVNMYLSVFGMQSVQPYRSTDGLMAGCIVLQVLLYLVSDFIQDYTCFNLYFAVDITLTLSMVALLPFTLREVGK